MLEYLGETDDGFIPNIEAQGAAPLAELISLQRDFTWKSFRRRMDEKFLQKHSGTKCRGRALASCFVCGSRRRNDKDLDTHCRRCLDYCRELESERCTGGE
jgi:hypothetical protein